MNTCERYYLPNGMLTKLILFLSGEFSLCLFLNDQTKFKFYKSRTKVGQSTLGMVLALHTVDPASILGTPYHSLNTA